MPVHGTYLGFFMEDFSISLPHNMSKQIEVEFTCDFQGQSVKFILIIYFNWRLITLQYCGGFCHTLTWISHGCAYDPWSEPPPTSFRINPSGLSQCTSCECPISCIKLELVIYFTYGNIYVSMLFSDIIIDKYDPMAIYFVVLGSCLYTLSVFPV